MGLPDNQTIDGKQEAPEELHIDLRDPRLAAFLAWLIPGAGHFYQGRIGKGILFMTCIWGTFFFGLYLGGGRVVYASMRGPDRRFAYFCQVGVGLAALPAIVQAYRMRDPNEPKPPLFGGFMAPPMLRGQVVHKDALSETQLENSLLVHYSEKYRIVQFDELHDWNRQLHGYFELGTVYTMIAGLLNVLAIYDAWGGPLLIVSDRRKKQTDEQDASLDEA